MVIEATPNRYCVVCDQCGSRAYDETYATIAEATNSSAIKELEGWDTTLDTSSQYRFRHVCPRCQVALGRPRIHRSNIIGTSGCIMASGIVDLTAPPTVTVRESNILEDIRSFRDSLFQLRAELGPTWDDILRDLYERID